MKIFIKTLDEGIHEMEEDVDPAILELEDQQSFPNPLHVSLYIDRFDNAFRFKIRIQTDAFFSCDRCLEPFAVKFDEKIEQIFQVGRGEFRDDDEVEILPDNVQEIDISKVLQDCITINLGIKTVCNDGCKGLCSNCGANLNKEQCRCKIKVIDPRLEKLKELLK